jgi:hypothetical protein
VSAATIGRQAPAVADLLEPVGLDTAVAGGDHGEHVLGILAALLFPV